MASLYKDVEQCVDRYRRKLATILEEKFTDVEETSQKIATKYIKMPPTKNQAITEFKNNLQNSELTSILFVEGKQSPETNPAQVKETNTYTYNEQLKGLF
jgi:hypothetical protein